MSVLAPNPGLRRMLYATGASVGNGADLTADVMQTYTLPANTLVNVGDTIRVFASGTFGATTDGKQIRLRFGGSNTAIPFGNTAANTRWSADVVLMKTGSNTQSWGANATTLVGPFPAAGTLTFTDTATVVVDITGQNNTSSVAGSITCQVFMVEFIPAP